MELYNTLYAMGAKEAGSSTGHRARKYISTYLRQHFPQDVVREESFQIHRHMTTGAKLIFGDLRIQAHLYENTGVEGTHVEGPVKFAGIWPLLFPGDGLKGKIIVFKQKFFFHRLWLVKRVYESGGRAIIYVPKINGHIPKGLGFPYIIGSCPMPAIGIRKEDLHVLRKAKPATVKIEYASILEQDLQCANIGIRSVSAGQKGKPAIVLGAHYDSWYGGAHDNCIAVQMMTDVYEMLSKKKLRHPVQAVCFDAEEVGLTGSRYHVEQRSDDVAFYFNFEMPIPTKNGLLNTLFYSEHKVCKRALQRRRFLKSAIIPLPLKAFYRIFPAFPADIDDFYKQNTPSMTTFCNNPLAHTPLDNGENLRWKSYATIRESIFQTICEIDRVL